MMTVAAILKGHKLRADSLANVLLTMLQEASAELQQLLFRGDKISSRSSVDQQVTLANRINIV